MSLLKQQIRSFLHIRSAILRQIHFGDLTRKEVLELARLRHYAYHLRCRNSSIWTIDEMELLANALGYETNSIETIKQLVSLLSLLPSEQQHIVFRKAKLDHQKIRTRQLNHNLWKVDELYQIMAAL